MGTEGTGGVEPRSLTMHLAPFRKPARLAVGFGPKELPYRMAPDTPQKVGPPLPAWPAETRLVFS
jgi:hypothetical protein